MKQFSLTDALFLLVIIGLAVGWSLDRRPRPERFVIEATTNRAFILDTSTGQAWEQVLQQGNVSTPSSNEFLQAKPTGK